MRYVWLRPLLHDEVAALSPDDRMLILHPDRVAERDRVVEARMVRPLTLETVGLVLCAAQGRGPVPLIDFRTCFGALCSVPADRVYTEVPPDAHDSAFFLEQTEPE